MPSPLPIIRIISLTSHTIPILSAPPPYPLLTSPFTSHTIHYMLSVPRWTSVSIYLPLRNLSVTSPYLSLYSLQQDDDALNLKLSSIDEKGADHCGNNGNTGSKGSKGKVSPVGLRSWLWASRPGVLHTELFQPTASTLDQVRGSERGARGSMREGEGEKEAGGWVEGRIDGEVERWKDRGTEG